MNNVSPIAPFVPVTQTDNLARTVRVLPANPTLMQGARTKTKLLNVAAYCRVSTDEDDQLKSFAAQITKYTDMIGANPDWKLAGIFADEGLSGLSTKKRDEFNKMIAACKQGKIDLIITKSISRFARNTLDCIKHVRELKALGIGVKFEKENINTATMSNEMVLTMLSAFAQAESESISENVRWGKRHAMREGKVAFRYNGTLGYREGADGKPEIVPEDAIIIKRIYGGVLVGRSVSQIKESLESDGVPSPKGKETWTVGTILYMLKNEKYMGDLRLQKTYVADCISKQTKVNNGEVAQYYIENNHEPIIPKEIFHRVQEELTRRQTKRRVASLPMSEKSRYSGVYALSERLICGECGTHYRRVTWARNGKKKIVWRCINRLENGKKFCIDSPTIAEDKLHDAIVRALNVVLRDRERLLLSLDDSFKTALSSGHNSTFDPTDAQLKIAILEQRVSDIMALIGDDETAARHFEKSLRTVHDERMALIAQLGEVDNTRAMTAAKAAKYEHLMRLIKDASIEEDVYDDDLTRAVVDKIVVADKERLTVIFNGGIEVAVSCEK